MTMTTILYNIFYIQMTAAQRAYKRMLSVHFHFAFTALRTDCVVFRHKYFYGGMAEILCFKRIGIVAAVAFFVFPDAYAVIFVFFFFFSAHDVLRFRVVFLLRSSQYYLPLINSPRISPSACAEFFASPGVERLLPSSNSTDISAML